MEGIYQHYIIDLSSNNNFIQIPTVQGDGNEIRQIEIELIQNNVPYKIDSNDTTITIMGTKPDTKQIVNPCTLTSEGYILVDITSQMSAVPGRGDYQIVLFSKSKNSQLKSFPFIIITTAATFDIDYIVSTDEFQLLSNTLSKVEKDYTHVITEAKKSADAAKKSESNAKTSEANSKTSETNAKTSETNSKKSETNASTSATNASNSASKAKTSENNALASANSASTSATTATTKASDASASASKAKTSETNAKTSETNAKKSETNAASSATTASNKATDASNSASIATTKATEASNSSKSASTSATTATTKANEAKTSADDAKNYATKAESYAHGGTNTRDGEESDNAKYYYEQAKGISEGLNGTLLPMGTIKFSQLASQTKMQGYMYNISDEFTTNSTFKEGSGFVYPAGTNVYYTADGYWDCLAGTMVTGVKGNAESTYRKGNVNITKANIGLGNVENKSSATIRNEITDDNVINALGFTPIAKKDTSTEVISDNEPTGQVTGDFWLQSY